MGIAPNEKVKGLNISTPYRNYVQQKEAQNPSSVFLDQDKDNRRSQGILDIADYMPVSDNYYELNILQYALLTLEVLIELSQEARSEFNSLLQKAMPIAQEIIEASKQFPMQEIEAHLQKYYKMIEDYIIRERSNLPFPDELFTESDGEPRKDMADFIGLMKKFGDTFYPAKRTEVFKDDFYNTVHYITNRELVYQIVIITTLRSAVYEILEPLRELEGRPLGFFSKGKCTTVQGRNEEPLFNKAIHDYGVKKIHADDAREHARWWVEIRLLDLWKNSRELARTLEISRGRVSKALKPFDSAFIGEHYARWRQNT